jgi:hypothetical protein
MAAKIRKSDRQRPKMIRSEQLLPGMHDRALIFLPL